MKFNTVIVDWCGTLESNLQPRLHAITQACIDSNIPQPTISTLTALAGMSHNESMTQLLSNATETEKACFHQKLNTYLHRQPSTLIAKEDTLKWLSGHTNLCIFTNASLSTIQKKIKNYKIADYFEIIATVDHFTPKPDPAMLTHIQLELAVDAATCLVVGDHSNDLAAAHAAGMRCAIVKTGLISEKMIQQWPTQPDYICTDVNAIPTLIQKS